MKNILKFTIAMVFLQGIILNPVLSQTNSHNMSTSADNDNNNNIGKWGLLGLLGLLGFIKMNKTEKSGIYTSTNIPQNR